MAQNDKEHLGESQNKEWWGTKQGLLFNGVNQYGTFPTDATFESTLNQNETWTLENWINGASFFSNAFFSLLNSDTSQGTGFYWLTGSRTAAGASQLKDNYIAFCKQALRRTGYIDRITSLVTDLTYQFTHKFNGTLHYSTLPPTFDAFTTYESRIKKINIISTFSPTAFLTTDDLYPTGCKNMYLNYGDVNAGGGVNYFVKGVVRDLRIYTSELSDVTVDKNYHSMSATDTTNLWAEWKMAVIGDFYTFGGNLYARNSGSSGNGLDNGTGYDIQLIGYAGNIPTLTTIY